MKHTIRFYFSIAQDVVIDDTLNDVSIEHAKKEAEARIKNREQTVFPQLMSWEEVTKSSAE